MGKPNRIAEWRESRGLSQEDLAAQAEISPGYLSRMERGERNVSLKMLARISKALSVPESALVPKETRLVPLVGYVSAGSVANFFDLEQVSLDEIPAPDNATDKTVAVEIRGDSLGSFFDRWIAFYDDIRRPVTSDLMNQLCIVRLTDGRTLIKKIVKGTLKGRFTLLSQFEAPLYDAEVDFAAKITDLRPR